ncbi:uncharacterized protein LOC111592598 [Drosophila hydei]|uniref:Uncharacterized protein LOC111592598 n=1 Tax=Drosophila hydei TaxID=7224 RepID=A0A6J1L8Z7_DROHY|nr:uncharacterized protein LOC111592598 [Drosophila hydei]
MKFRPDTEQSKEQNKPNGTTTTLKCRRSAGRGYDGPEGNQPVEQQTPRVLSEVENREEESETKWRGATEQAPHTPFKQWTLCMCVCVCMGNANVCVSKDEGQDSSVKRKKKKKKKQQLKQTNAK